MKKLVRILCLNLVQISCCCPVAKSVIVAADLWSKHFVTSFWVLSTEALAGLCGSVAVGASRFDVQVVHSCWVTPLSAEPLSYLCRFFASAAFKQLEVYYKKTVRLYSVCRATGSTFQIDCSLPPDKTSENISYGEVPQSLWYAITAQWSRNFVSSPSERKHRNTFFP